MRRAGTCFFCRNICVFAREDTKETRNVRVRPKNKKTLFFASSRLRARPLVTQKKNYELPAGILAIDVTAIACAGQMRRQVSQRVHLA